MTGHTPFNINLACQVLTAVALSGVFVTQSALIATLIVIIPTVLHVLLGFIGVFKGIKLMMITYMASSVVLILIGIYHVLIIANITLNPLTSIISNSILIGKDISNYHTDLAAYNQRLIPQVKPTIPVALNITLGVYAVHLAFDIIGLLLVIFLPLSNDNLLPTSNQPDKYNPSMNPYSSAYDPDTRPSRSQGKSGHVMTHQLRQPYIPPESINGIKNPKYNKKSKFNANEPTLIEGPKKHKHKQNQAESQSKKTLQVTNGVSNETIVKQEQSTLEALYSHYIQPLLSVSKVSQKVIKRHLPNINDEVYLEVGDMVLVEEVFDDGWAVGTNESTDKYGAFPMNCLEDSVKKGNRHESMYFGN